MSDFTQSKKSYTHTKETPHTLPAYIINLAFILGLISALAFRALIIFQHIEPALVRPLWYTGVIGYTFFFLYRYAIAHKRKRAITEYDLIEKLHTATPLSETEKQTTIYLLESINKSRENINYLWIFITSIIAIIIDIVLSIYGV
jgi:hypothetical protein